MSNLYSQTKRANSKGDERRVTIREVNVDKMFVIGETALGDKLRINFTLLDPLVAVPAPGEIWTLVQYANEWRLSQRMETGSETKGVRTLAPGDRRLEATNNVHINGKDVIINGISLTDVVKYDVQEIGGYLDLTADTLGPNGTQIILKAKAKESVNTASISLYANDLTKAVQIIGGNGQIHTSDDVQINCNEFWLFIGTSSGNSPGIHLSGGVQLYIRDRNGNPIFRIDEADGSVHIKTGTSIVADL